MTIPEQFDYDAGPGPRRGVALMAAVVVLVIMALVMSAISWQIVATGRALKQREYQLQANLLVRAGIEIGAARILEQPAEFRAQPLDIVDRASVTIDAESVSDRPNVYILTCVARYPTDVPHPVARRLSRTFERVTDGDRVRLLGAEPDE